MQVLENVSLKPFNTFNIDARAKKFCVFSSTEEMESVLDDYRDEKRLLLGGGSNILLTKDFDGLVLKNELKGIDLIKEDQHHYYVKVAAGENWHAFVLYCIDREYAGVENLSLIPGCVGAAPMQNIGAYGVEVKQVFEQLEAYDLGERKILNFSLNDCAFGYRESVFKRKYRDRFVILNVTFRLRKQPDFHIEYGAVKQELERMGVTHLTIRAVSDAVIRIRSSKLPDPRDIGNAGSFFKNPEIDNSQYEALSKVFPGMVAYPAGESKMKIAAGWLIEQCGWKGYREGDAGCHARQALVLVNYGNATGEQVFQLSEKIQASVKEKFGIDLEREVNVI